MAIADLNLTTRAEAGAALTATQHDNNLTATQDKANEVAAEVNKLTATGDTYGEMYLTGNSTATSGSGAWTLVAGTFAGDQLDTVAFSVADSALVLPAGDWLVMATVSFQGQANHTYGFGLALDGTTKTNHIAKTRVTATDHQSVSLFGFVTATVGQKLTLRVYDYTGTGNVTVTDATVGAKLLHPA